MVLAEDGERGVVRRSGRGADAARDLLLHHDGHGGEAAALQQARQDRRRDIIRQVGTGGGRQAGEFRLHKGRKVHFHGVGKVDGEVVELAHGLRQHGAERRVQLDGRHTPGAEAQLLRQRAEAGADLQHAG